MSVEAWPTEEAATVAVDVAARKVFEAQRPDIPGVPQVEWEHLSPTVKLGIRESVLPIIWAALAALPDPRYAAWIEGFEEGSDDTFGSTGACPYPSGV